MAGKAAILAIRIVSDAKDAQKGISDAEGRLDKFQSRIDKAAVPSAAVLAGIGALSTAVIDYASEAQQAVGAVETVFKGHADEVKTMAAQADQALGLSEASYNTLAAAIGGSLSQAGYAQDELVGKTNDLIVAAADLSSVFGGDAASAAEAMGAALRGEFDSLERYGVFLNAAAVQAELARTGQDKLTGSALDAAKKQATHNLIMQQASRYAGNFAKESDTAAGAQQRAAAAADNARAKLGDALLPAYTQLQVILASVATFVSDNSTAFMILAGVLAGIAATVLATSAAIRVYTTVKTLWTVATNAATVAQKAFNAAMKANPIGLIITAVTILIGLFVLAYQKVDWFRAGVDTAVAFIAGIWTSLVELLGSLWNGLVNTVMQLVGNFRANFAKAVAAARAIWNGLVSFARGLWNGLVSFLRTYINIWKAAFTTAVNAARAVWNTAVNVIKSVWNTATGVIRSAWDNATGKIRTGIEAVRSKVQSAMNLVKSIVKGAADRVRTVMVGAWEAVKRPIDVVRSAVETLIGWIQKAIDKMGPLKEVGSWIGGLFSSGYQRPAVASTIPADGSPFYLHAASGVGLIPKYPVMPAGRGVSGPARVVNINVTGAIDPNETARQIKRLLRLDTARDGAFAWGAS